MADINAIPTERVPVDETDQQPRARRIKERDDPNTISLGDEASLSWYFGRGLSIYERSTFSSIVERIKLDGFNSTTCAQCDGAGILETGGFATATRCTRCTGKGELGSPPHECPDCRGSGQIEPYEVRCETGGWCDACRGSGCTSVERRALRRKPCSLCDGNRRLAAFNATPGAHSIPCGRCVGTGHEPLTAAPVSKGDEGGGVVANDAALNRFAIISRRVATVDFLSPALSAALEDYYGDTGSRWGREDFGRIFALYAHTPAGKRLARWGAAEGSAARNPKGKKSKRAAKNAEEAARSGTRWKNPQPVLQAYPFRHTVKDAIGDFSEDARNMRGRGKLEKLGDFIGPRRLNGSCYAQDPMLIGSKYDATDEADSTPVEDLPIQAKIWSQVAAERSQPKKERAVLIAAANKQARELYLRAVRAWNDTSLARRDKLAMKLVKRLAARGALVAANDLAARSYRR